MCRIVGFVAIVLMVTASPSWGDFSGFSLEVEIRGVGEQGDVYFRLADRGAFEQPADTNHFRIGGIIPIQTRERAGENLTFVLKNVPSGRYVLQAFQDINGNGELDIGIFGPKEPWGNYRASRPRFRAPTFEECVFDVNGSLNGIIVDLE